jgi:glycosyltransferase involved in cell wall biosynthesis
VRDRVSALKHAFVVPAYGDSRYLGECLASLRWQTLPGSEILVTTSTPSREIEAVASAHAVEVRINSRRGSIGSDWNFALAATGAELVTLAHQDDLYEPRYAKTLLTAMRARPDALIAFCDYREVTHAGPRPDNLNLHIKRLMCRANFGRRNALTSVSARRRLLSLGNPICCPSVILNRARVPDFRFIESMRSNLDWDAWMRLAERPGDFVYVREPLVVRRIHGQSETSAAIADRQREAEDRQMFGRVWPGPVAALIARVYRASFRANRS